MTEIINASAQWALPHFDDGEFQCCVTSPPYWGLRDYDHEDQLGNEPSFYDYINELVSVFSEVRRVLRDDGTLWLNMGDSYAGTGKTGGGRDGKARGGMFSPTGKGSWLKPPAGMKIKDLVGQPWTLVQALRADGWFLRSEVVWAKTNFAPESVRDRPTKAHETIFLLSKNKRYKFDKKKTTTVWEFPPTRGGWHRAMFPVELPRRCLSLSCTEGDSVLDPFSGAGTTGLACQELCLDYTGIEINPEYAEKSRMRLSGLFA